MSITLRPETEKQIHDRMTDGGYPSPDDVVRAGLKLLEQRDRERQAALSGLRDKIAVGLAQADRGEVVDGEAAFEELLAELERDGDAR